MRPIISFYVVALATLIVAGCSKDDSSNPVPASTPIAAVPPPVNPDANRPGFFTDMTETSGIRFSYKNGEEPDSFAILESLGGGIGLIDYNRDGRLDIVATGGGKFGKNKDTLGHPNRLFRNDDNWKFTDVTGDAGLPAEGPFYSHGCAVGDYDNDGWPDLLITGYGRLALYKNNQGKFADVTEAAGLRDNRDLHWSTSAGWCDLDGDGRLDLYVAHYVNWHLTKFNPTCKDSAGQRRDICSPKEFDGLPHALYWNNGNGTFTDGAEAAGIKPGKGLGVVIADLTGDRKPDIYVANDTTDNHLYVNLGDRKFREEARPMQVARGEEGVANGSMGVDVADYDGSGFLSVFVTNYQNEPHALYRNGGDGAFRFASSRAGVLRIGLQYVGFGTGFFDFDRDGAEDLFITNGHVVRFPPHPATLKQRPVLLRNRRKPGDKPFDVTFENVTNQGGPYFHAQHTGRGVAFGDLDNDGRIDLVLNSTNEPIRLLRNTLENRNGWLGVTLVGKDMKDATSAKLYLEVGGQKLLRTIKGGGSYLSASDRRVIFGLGSAVKADRLTVEWPSGKTQTWEGKDLPVDRYLTLVEDEAQPRATIALAGSAP